MNQKRAYYIFRVVYPDEVTLSLSWELKGMLELQMLPWAGEVRQFFLEMNKQKKKDLHNKKTLVGLLCYAIMKSVTMSW